MLQGHLNANRAPMKAHEIVLVFCKSKLPFYPIKTTGHQRKVSTKQHRRNSKESTNYGSYKENQPSYDSTERYPRDVLRIKSDRQKSAIVPTQKPVGLSTYLLQTYTTIGSIVLDNAMGSGSTGISCIDTGRRFIGIERDPDIFKMAEQRILNHKDKLKKAP